MAKLSLACQTQSWDLGFHSFTWTGTPEPAQHPTAESRGVTLGPGPEERPQSRNLPQFLASVPFLVLHGGWRLAVNGAQETSHQLHQHVPVPAFVCVHPRACVFACLCVCICVWQVACVMTVWNVTSLLCEENTICHWHEFTVGLHASFTDSLLNLFLSPLSLVDYRLAIYPFTTLVHLIYLI